MGSFQPRPMLPRGTLIHSLENWKLVAIPFEQQHKNAAQTLYISLEGKKERNTSLEKMVYMTSQNSTCYTVMAFFSEAATVAKGLKDVSTP